MRFMLDKFELPFSHSEGRSAELELCVYCKRITNLHDIGKCEYFAEGYVGHKCVAFDSVDNVAERTLEALDVKCGKIKTKNH